MLKTLPSDVLSLLRASVKINNYKTAVKELIYNSLDADSTSIAIRIHIKDNSIQLVDNGQGIKEIDMNSLGQRYMTSKFISLSALKSTPEKYGLHGESLANIIEVSQFVSVTSRYEHTEETWVQTFNEGKRQKLVKTTNRPSKGTTISIKGFLYNRKIQRKTLNELHELQEIKTFLEQISLIHDNISLSLRDDAKNELIFQLHKKRDIYQTLSTLLNISKSDVEELNVEKNEYKVKAYIGKTTKDIRKHWIFLNAKPIHTNSQLQIIVNDTLNKSIKSRNSIIKTKIRNNNSENYLFGMNVPFYFIFIKCPYQEYIRHKNLDFKNWHQITKLLEKLLRFYVGDIFITEVKNSNIKQKPQECKDVITRDKIKDMVQKILDSNSNNKEGLQMQNGVQGKISKRKYRKKKETHDDHSIIRQRKATIAVKEATKKEYIKQITNVDCLNKCENLPRADTPNNVNRNIVHIKPRQNTNCEESCDKKVTLKNNTYRREIKESIKINNNITTKNNAHKTMKRKRRKYQNKSRFFADSVIRKFINPSDSLIKKCNLLYQGINISSYRNKNMLSNERIQDGNLTKKMHRAHSSKTLCENHKTHQVSESLFALKSTYDLVKPVTMNTRYINNDSHIIKEYSEKSKTYSISNKNVQFTTQLTYQSHNYNTYRTIKKTGISHEQQRKINNSRVDNKYSLIKLNPELTTVTSRMHLNHNNEKRICFNIQNSIHRNIEKESSCTIEFSKINKRTCDNKNKDIEIMCNETKHYKHDLSFATEIMLSEIDPINKTIDKEVNISKSYSNSFHDSRDILISLNDSKSDNNKAEDETINKNNKSYVESNLHYSKLEENVIEPLNVCKTTFSSEDLSEYEISKSLNVNSSKFHDEELNMSHYFTISNNFIKLTDVPKNSDIGVQENQYIDFNVDTINKIGEFTQDNFNKIQFNDINYSDNIVTTDVNFAINNRLRFIPKGMSQIFKNCNTKNDCDYYLSEDYYEDSIYVNFVNQVHMHSEIFNPLIQNVGVNPKGLTEKFLSKMNSANTALKFNGESLKYAKVLGQIDDKFIASVIKTKDTQIENNTHFLVVFDQHAVDERIRTEKNLSDYFSHGRWKSIKQAELNIILSNEEIVYLHNYQDKFSELGLQFNIVSAEEISINAIPEAILGKVPRQIDKIMKAVRNLIVEEINAIKSQRGSISMYPKAIMNLIFSESCRYAIKFGDRLTKNDCIKLINELSCCNTPYQCAHGRPVMAVIMELNSNQQEYKIDFTNVKKFKSKNILQIYKEEEAVFLSG